MRVALAAVGTDSEVLPMMALGRAFQMKGHTVTLCVPESYRSLSMQVGLRMVTSGAHFQQYLDPDSAPHSNKALAEALGNEVPVHFVAMRDALRHADVAIGAPLQTAGPSIAEQQGIPYFCAIQTPVHLDRAQFPCWGLATRDSGLFSSLRLRSRRKVWHESVLRAINRERDFTHLPPVNDLYDHFFHLGHQLIAVDPGLAFIENSPERTVTGFWFFDAPEIDSELQSFLDSGPPPVFIELHRASEDQIKILCERLKEDHHRVLIRSRHEVTLLLPDGCRQLDETASLELLQRASVAVHEGSARLVAAAARAGIPQVIQPDPEDQRFWGDAVQKAGLSLSPLFEPTAERILRAIQEALNSQPIKLKANEVGERLRSYDGAVRAVEAVEALLKMS